MTLPLTEALEELIALGVEGPALIAAIRRLEAVTYETRIATLEEAVAVASAREDEALRNRRERQEKDAQRKRVRRTSADIRGNPGTSADNPPPPSFPPEPPKPPTPTRECVTTRASREREEAAFGRFWSAYPRKVGKADARKAFTRAWRKLPPMEEELILSGGLERAQAAWTDAQFIPHAATWLNGERWQDEPGEVIQLQPRKANDRPHHDRSPTPREDRLGRMLRGAMAAVDERKSELG